MSKVFGELTRSILKTLGLIVQGDGEAIYLMFEEDSRNLRKALKRCAWDIVSCCTKGRVEGGGAAMVED